MSRPSFYQTPHRRPFQALRLLADNTRLIVPALLAIFILTACTAQEPASQKPKDPPSLTAALFPEKKPFPSELRPEKNASPKPRENKPSREERLRSSDRIRPIDPRLQDRGPGQSASDQPQPGGPASPMASFYGLKTRGELYAGEANNLELFVLAKGQAVREKLRLAILPHPALPNLRTVARETDSAGRLTLRGLMVKNGYDKVPITVDLGPGLTRVTKVLAVQPAPCQMKVAKIASRGLALGEAKGSGTRSTETVDATLAVACRGQAYLGRVAFLPQKNLPNLRPHPRKANSLGQISLKGLMVQGQGQLVGRLDSGALVQATLNSEGLGRATAQNPSDPSQAASSLTASEPNQSNALSSSLNSSPEKPKAKAQSSFLNQAIDLLRPGADGQTEIVPRALTSVLNRLSAALGERLSPYGQWRARAAIDSKGDFLGGADYLYPFVDRGDWLVFGQGGFSVGERGRVLAHIGAGQRLFFGENMALGYNAFLEGELKNAHYRGGLGLELWRNNLKLAANLYQSLGPWRPSPDYPNWPVLEKAASGWDVRAEARPSFAPSLAFLGALEKWRGPQVGSFDPQKGRSSLAYTYGLSWSPWPLLTATLTQTRGQGQKTQTNVGLSFNFRPGTPEEAREIATAPKFFRHDFVDRDYSLPIAYKGESKVKIILIGPEGPGVYRFKVIDGFGRSLPNITIHSTVADKAAKIYDPLTLKEASRFATDAAGEFVALYRSPTGASTLTTHRADQGQGQFTVAPDVTPTPTEPVAPPSAPEEPSEPNPPTETGDPDEPSEPNEPSETGDPDEPNEPSETDEPNEPNPPDETGDPDEPNEPSETGDPDEPSEPNPPAETGDPDEPSEPNPPAETGDPDEPAKPNEPAAELTYFLALTASDGPHFVFALTDQNGQPAANQTVEAETLSPAVPVYAHKTSVATKSFATDANGLFSLTLGPTPGYPVVGLALTPSKGEKKSFDLPLPHNLKMTAAPTSLYVGESASVWLTVLFNDAPLPQGTLVNLAGPNGAFTGLPAAAAVNGDGRIELASLTAAYAGNLTINGTVAGYSAGSATFSVANRAPAPIDALTLLASPLSLNFGEKTTVVLTINKNGAPLPFGSEVTVIADPGLLIPNATATLTADGQLTLNGVVGLSLGPQKIKVRHGSLVSDEATITVTAAGTLTLKAITTELEYLVPTDAVLAVELNGQPLPSGAQTEIQVSAGLEGAPSSQAAEANGRLTLAQVVAKNAGPLTVSVRAYGLSSNSVSLAVRFDSSQLTLAASPQSLEYLIPTDATFTLKYRNQPLPAGLTATLTSQDQRISGLGSAQVKAGGQVSFSGIQALWPTGPLTVKAQVAGFSGEPTASFGVYLQEAGVSLKFTLDPRLNSAGELTSTGTDPYIVSCREFQVAIAVAYQGRPAAGIPATIQGLGFSKNGQALTTSASGEVSGTIYYGRDNKNDSPSYSIAIGQITATRPGPTPLNFNACNP